MKEKEAELSSLTKAESDGFDVADLFSKTAQFLVSAVEKQNDANIKIAEINKPITTKQLEIQELGIKNQHEAWLKATDANINKDKREFTTNSIIAGSILLFLMVCAFILIYKSEYQLALSIITLLIGFIGGYSAKSQIQKQQENKQS